MKDVLCAGILVADVICQPLEKIPAAGELVVTERFVLRTGGCAANTSVDLQKLGRSVTVVGRVGDDLFGEFVSSQLRSSGIETAIVKSSTHPTSATTVINVRGDDRRFIHCIGANADFRTSDINVALLYNTRILYLGGFMVMPACTAPDVADLFAIARKHNVRTVLDVVIPAGLNSTEGVVQVLKHTDVFLPNSDEARLLTSESDPVLQVKALASFNPDCTIVITMGGDGVVAYRNGEILSAAAYPVESVDESGAGDAFSAGFMVGMLEQWPLDQTIRFASAVGAFCTRALGCTDGVSDYNEVKAFSTAHPLRIDRIS